MLKGLLNHVEKMPFKERIKQLRYMRKHAKENRELLKQCKAKMKLTETLTKKMIKIARNTLQERRNYPVELVHNFKVGVTLQMAFVLNSEDALKSATEAICNEEDELIRKYESIRKIGIIHDLQLSLLNDKVGLIWEKITPLSEDDLLNLDTLN